MTFTESDIPYPPEPQDRRAPEQHMADVADATLERLARINDEVSCLGDQFAMLAIYIHESDPIASRYLAMLENSAVVLHEADSSIYAIRQNLPRRVWIPPAIDNITTDADSDFS